MFKAFRISYALKNTYRVNGIIYSVRQIPLLKRILPDTLYRLTWIKVLATIISALWELISTFSGKLIYLYIISSASFFLQEKGCPYDPFLHILFLLTIIGAYMNTYMLNPTNDKYYALILMRMNAKEYTLSNYIYSMLRVFLGFLPFVILFGTQHGLSPLACAALPLFIVGTKLIFAWIYLLRYQKKGTCTNENLPTKAEWILTAVLLAAAFGLPFLNIALPQAAALWLMLPSAAGVYAAVKISRFDDYRDLYRILLASKKDGMDYNAAKREAVEKQSRKIISVDAGIVSGKQGFEYLNELFIKRHRKILWKPAQRVAIFALGAVAIALLSFRMTSDIAHGINGMLMHRLPYFVFVMYAINRGRSFTQALFMNCDDGLLTYSFYKKPAFILRLFRIRLWEIIKVNLLPAAVISAGLPLLIYFSGGTKNPLDYIVIPLTVLLLSAFFSVHYLACYYLLQPYNAGTEMKSGTYQIVMFLTYLVCVVCMQIKVNTLIFGILVCCACIIYCIIACILVYKLAYKTFKLRG